MVFPCACARTICARWPTTWARCRPCRCRQRKASSRKVSSKRPTRKRMLKNVKPRKRSKIVPSPEPLNPAAEKDHDDEKSGKCERRRECRRQPIQSQGHDAPLVGGRGGRTGSVCLRRADTPVRRMGQAL